MTLSGKHRALSARQIQGRLRSTQGSPRPTQGLPRPMQDFLKPYNALACQLKAFSGHQMALSCQCRLVESFQVDKGFPHGNLGSSQGSTGPSQTDGLPSWTKEGTFWSKRGPSEGQHRVSWSTEGLLRQSHGPVMPRRDLLTPNSVVESGTPTCIVQIRSPQFLERLLAV